MKHAIIYKNNYMNVLSKYAGFRNYERLMKKINQFSNPVSFYKFMSKDDITVDLTYQSDTKMIEAEFDAYLIRLGIDIDTDMFEGEI